MSDGIYVAGRYRLEAIAGEGGMATVWRATDVVRRRPVALKRVREDGRNVDDARALFADEVAITRSVHHPRVARFVDAGRDELGDWLAVEWVEGTDALLLTRHLERPIGVRAALSVAQDLLGALAVVHAAPLAVLHRDVAPANVLLGTDGRAVLADFGIARALARPRTHGVGNARGKIGYLAPEVLHGAIHAVRADVYGAALVLWELLAGRRVFAHLTPGPERMRAFLDADRPRLRGVNPRVPAALADVIDAGLSRDPARRPRSARALLDALHDAARRCRLRADPAELARAVRETYVPPMAERSRRKKAVRQGSPQRELITAARVA